MEGLDFWIGQWALTWDGGHGTNTVTREMDGHVITERFQAVEPEPFGGLSVSVLGADGVWRQTWVDSTGAYLDLVGVEVDGRISFQRETTVGGVAATQRMVWLDVTLDAFRWQWQRSGDGGATWEVAWEIDYRRV